MGVAVIESCKAAMQEVFGPIIAFNIIITSTAVFMSIEAHWFCMLIHLRERYCNQLSCCMGRLSPKALEPSM